MKVLYSCHNGFLLVKRGMVKAALAAALGCLAVSAVSCRTIKEIEVVTDTVQVHDTNEVYIHDTTKVTETKYDSVDRYVEKIVYVDSNGVWHEKEKETLIHYIYQQDEKYKVMEAYYKKQVSKLEKKLEEKQKVEYVEKNLNWFQKTLMYLGVAFIIALVGFGIYMYFRIKKKIKT